jgi:hypothetical protein
MHARRPAAAPTDPVLTPRHAMVVYWTGPWTRAAVEAWTADMAARWAADRVGKWMARDRSDGSLVGRGGFTRFDLDGETPIGRAVIDALQPHGRSANGQADRAGWRAFNGPGMSGRVMGR